MRKRSCKQQRITATQFAINLKKAGTKLNGVKYSFEFQHQCMDTELTTLKDDYKMLYKERWNRILYQHAGGLTLLKDYWKIL